VSQKTRHQTLAHNFTKYYRAGFKGGKLGSCPGPPQQRGLHKKREKSRKIAFLAVRQNSVSIIGLYRHAMPVGKDLSRGTSSTPTMNSVVPGRSS